jgi:hypothetical protein
VLRGIVVKKLLLKTESWLGRGPSLEPIIGIVIGKVTAKLEGSKIGFITGAMNRIRI